MSDVERYRGKPFLRLLELYVLWAIDSLNEEEIVLLQAMTPKLQKIYSSSGDWHETVAEKMAFPSNMKNIIGCVWSERKSAAGVADEELSPVQFALNFVDVNFPH